MGANKENIFKKDWENDCNSARWENEREKGRRQLEGGLS